MSHEHLANAETLSNIYSKRAILKEFSGGHKPPYLYLVRSNTIYSWAHAESFVLGGGGNPKKAPHRNKKGLPYAEKLTKRPQISILLKYSYIFASEKALRKCPPKRTKLRNKQTFWGVCFNIPLNIIGVLRGGQGGLAPPPPKIG